MEKMLFAFQLNLTALSAISLFVGIFLIYNTLLVSVVHRRKEIGILRSLGVTRLRIFLLFLWEGIVLGTLGGLGGAHRRFSRTGGLAARRPDGQRDLCPDPPFPLFPPPVDLLGGDRHRDHRLGPLLPPPRAASRPAPAAGGDGGDLCLPTAPFGGEVLDRRLSSSA
ncbi:MAG: ABC transporter permease [Candidatus Manganitrophus sp.]|nr:MAG: ABC transporter permease [Candidatus Manganitrophus sp.]